MYQLKHFIIICHFLIYENVFKLYFVFFRVGWWGHSTLYCKHTCISTLSQSFPMVPHIHTPLTPLLLQSMLNLLFYQQCQHRALRSGLPTLDTCLCPCSPISSPPVVLHHNTQLLNDRVTVIKYIWNVWQNSTMMSYCWFLNQLYF